MTVLNPLSLSERRLPDKQLLTNLSRFQRILMVTDGTVTELLEQYLSEKIKVAKLYEKVVQDFSRLIPAHQTHISPDLLPVLSRAILLEGQTTKQHWIYAESSIMLNNLTPGFRSDLLASREPIGRLWEKYRYETFKVVLDFEKREAGELGQHFQLPPHSIMISRTYSVYSQSKIIMIITEVFPACFFQD